MGKLKRDLSQSPLDEDVASSLTEDEKSWLRSWNRSDEIPGESPDVSDDVEDEEDETPDDTAYDSWTVPQLRKELENRELPTGGNKAELVERLEEDDDNDE